MGTPRQPNNNSKTNKKLEANMAPKIAQKDDEKCSVENAESSKSFTTRELAYLPKETGVKTFGTPQG